MANAAATLLAGRPEAVALIEPGQQITYAELRGRVMNMAAAWRAQGLTPGDTGVIALADGIDSVATLLGLIWMGGVPVPVSPRTEPFQVPELLAESRARLMIAEDAFAASLADGNVLGRSAWKEMAARLPHEISECHQADRDTAALMLFSSGTTGKPKGIVHAHRCVEQAHVFAEQILGVSAADRFFSTSKLFFAYPLANSLFAGLRLGASVMLDPEWPNPERVAKLVAQYKPTVLFSVPTLYQRLLESGLAFASIRRCVSAGEACPPALASAWERQTGLAIVNGYGTTETLSLALFRLPKMPGFIATPLTMAREEFSDPNDPEASLRLWFSHPALALGYTRIVSHDSAQFAGTEFSPGDVFHRVVGDAGAGWVFAGRSDQLLKVYGRWVDTVALEHWLFEKLQGRVRELSIVPHEADGGPVSLHLFVSPVSEDGVTLGARVQAVCAELPTFKRPAQTHILAELPRTETGKVRRGILRAMC